MDTRGRVKEIKKLLNLAFGDHHDAKNKKDLKRMFNLVQQAKEKIQSLEEDLQTAIDNPELVDELLNAAKKMPVPLDSVDDQKVIATAMAADPRPEQKPSLGARIKNKSKKIFSNREKN